VFVFATVLGLSGAGAWTVIVLFIAGPVAMWTAPHDEPDARPGYPADRYRRGDDR